MNCTHPKKKCKGTGCSNYAIKCMDSGCWSSKPLETIICGKCDYLFILQCKYGNTIPLIALQYEDIPIQIKLI